MITKNELITELNNEIVAHKDAISNLTTTAECIVVVPHIDFGSGFHNSGETIGVDSEGICKLIHYTNANEVKAFTIKDAKKACKTRLCHEKDIKFDYKYELVDIKEWHSRRIAELEHLVSKFA